MEIVPGKVEALRNEAAQLFLAKKFAELRAVQAEALLDSICRQVIDMKKDFDKANVIAAASREAAKELELEAREMLEEADRIAKTSELAN